MEDSVPRRFLLVVSPTAGGGSARKAAPDLIQRLRAAGADVEAELSESLDHAEALAAEGASAGRIVVAVGGDGLLNSVVNGAADVAGAVVGLVPGGTANDFARSIGITPRNAVEILLGAMPRPTDLGHAAGRYFTCIASVGFDSKVIETSVRTRHVPARFLYPYAVLKCLASWTPQRFTVHHDGQTQSFEGFSVAAANARCFGGGMLLAPDALVDDGLFDVVTITARSRAHFLRWAPMIFSGGHLRSPEVHVWRAERLVVETAEPFQVYADGEVLGPTPLEIDVRQGAVGFLRTA